MLVFNTFTSHIFMQHIAVTTNWSLPNLHFCGKIQVEHILLPPAGIYVMYAVIYYKYLLAYIYRLHLMGYAFNSFIYPTHLSSMYHINSTISVSIYSHFYQLSITISFHHKNTISNHRLLNDAINPSFT